MTIRHYKEIFVEPPIYIRYVVLTIVICTYMLSIELFYRIQNSSFHGCFFEYLPIFLHLQVCGIYLTRFKEFRTFWPCYFVDLLVKVIDNFWKIRGLIDGFNELCRKIASAKEKPQMSQWVPYDSVPPLKEIYRTNHISLGIRSHWGQR